MKFEEETRTLITRGREGARTKERYAGCIHSRPERDCRALYRFVVELLLLVKLVEKREVRVERARSAHFVTLECEVAPALDDGVKLMLQQPSERLVAAAQDGEHSSRAAQTARRLKRARQPILKSCGGGSSRPVTCSGAICGCGGGWSGGGGCGAVVRLRTRAFRIGVDDGAHEPAKSGGHAHHVENGGAVERAWSVVASIKVDRRLDHTHNLQVCETWNGVARFVLKLPPRPLLRALPAALRFSPSLQRVSIKPLRVCAVT
eukprot:940358-Pleurochrysis_carterae.AAC.1